MCGGERPHPMVAEAFEAGQETVVLCSGGLDSAVLLAHEAQTRKVQPIYVSTGLAWEHVEYQWMLRFLDALGPKIQPSVNIVAISLGVPGPKFSFLNSKLPASKIITSKPSERISSIIVAFRARPPRGRFFQPQGSVSPCTLAVVAILIVFASVACIISI